jgi:hypothetical protein
MNAIHRGRPSTFEEIHLAAAGRPVTVQAAFMVMIDEMNHYLGTDHLRPHPSDN